MACLEPPLGFWEEMDQSKLANSVSGTEMKRFLVPETSWGLGTSGWGLGELELGLDTFVFPRRLQSREDRLHRFALSRGLRFPKTLELLFALL